MLFNSFHFIFFFPIVVALFFAIPHRYRWMLLLAASYYFYAVWRVEYLILIIGSTIVDYAAALGIGAARTKATKRAWLVLSLLTNLGLLFTFKYYGFAATELQAVFHYLGSPVQMPVLDVLLPVGISFYTFQTLSYTIDVYRGERNPERHLGYFAVYVSFFPQLVAGPIERSTSLLPQFFEKKSPDAARMSSGLQLMAWGFFKKLVIADRLAIYVNEVYGHPGDFTGLALILATIFFAYQIYCDFSGYSDIAIGAARVMGYDLMTNFRRPYFARSIREFWQRWHISLSTWFRDYVYIPLGGNRTGKARWYFNLLATFVISGVWHGANWTFLVWGFLHGFYLTFSILTHNLRERMHRLLGLDRHPRVLALLQMFTVFVLANVAWVFFRAHSISEAWWILRHMPQIDLAHPAINVALNPLEIVLGVLLIVFLELVQSFQERGLSIRARLDLVPAWVRWSAYSGLVLVIVVLGMFQSEAFIYFQF